MVSLAKGCYIGQETIAKVFNTGGMPIRPVSLRAVGQIDMGDCRLPLPHLRARCRVRTCFLRAGEKQQLWGLRLRQGETCSVGDAVLASAEADARRLGAVTSTVQQKDGSFALAYLRSKKKGAQVALEGSQVFIKGQPAKVRTPASRKTGKRECPAACNCARAPLPPELPGASAP